MSLNPLKIRFFPKALKGDKSNFALYLRLTYKQQRTEICLGHNFPTKDWDNRQQCIVRSNKNYKNILELTNTYRTNALNEFNNLIRFEEDFDVFRLKEKIVGEKSQGQTEDRSFTALFRRMIQRKAAKATVQKYNRCLNHFVTFLAANKMGPDLSYSKINLKLIEDFELYLKTLGKCKHNSTMKHVQTLKTIFRAALSYGYAVKDPFQSFRFRLEEVNRGYLSEEEIKNMQATTIANKTLNQVKDLFLFCCFTGLAYIDLKSLKRENIHQENDKIWIRTLRQKTGTKTNVPLLPSALKILLDYNANFLELEPTDYLFNIISNQKTNVYLKEVAKLSGIKKKLTSHIARHSFATTVTLSNGVPIETVSSMLGHKQIRTTQHYAKIIDKKVGEDMEKLESRLNY
jgi:site-specific recombinase XerD